MTKPMKGQKPPVGPAGSSNQLLTVAVADYGVRRGARVAQVPKKFGICRRTGGFNALGCGLGVADGDTAKSEGRVKPETAPKQFATAPSDPSFRR